MDASIKQAIARGERKRAQKAMSARTAEEKRQGDQREYEAELRRKVSAWVRLHIASYIEERVSQGATSCDPAPLIQRMRDADILGDWCFMTEAVALAAKQMGLKVTSISHWEEAWNDPDGAYSTPAGTVTSYTIHFEEA